MIHQIRKAIKSIIKQDTPLRKAAESCQHYLFKHAPRYFAWEPDKSFIEIDITTRCNLRCPNCDRTIVRAPSDEHMSLDQINRFVDESISMDWEWRRINLLGGEPTLHPDFNRIVKILLSYREMNPECEIKVLTNGYGAQVKKVLSNLPDSVNIENSQRTKRAPMFHSQYVAPIDVEKFRNDNFSNGCFVIEYCGIGMSRYGYYCCGAGAAVDRVFGFDIGLKSLSSVTDEALKKQLKLLCAYCGHYKYNYNEKWVNTEKASKSWQNAIDKYNKKRPVLTLY